MTDRWEYGGTQKAMRSALVGRVEVVLGVLPSSVQETESKYLRQHGLEVARKEPRLAIPRAGSARPLETIQMDEPEHGGSVDQIYEEERQIWIDNGWLALEVSEEELAAWSR